MLNPADVAADLIGSGSATPAPAMPTETPKPAPEAASAPSESGPAMPTPDGKMDRAGRVFDPARYKSRPDGTPFVNRDGYFMPIGGKRKAASALATPAAPAAPTAPVFNLPPAPARPAWSEAEKAAAAAAPAADPGDSAGSGAAPTAAVEDHSDDAAEVFTQTLYFTVGVLIGSMDEATPDKAEHANFLKAVSAYIRTTGWKGTALTCMLMRTCAYLLRVFRKPKASAQVEAWIASFRAKKPAAMPVSEPKPAAGQSTSAPSNPPAPPARAKLVSLGGFSERSAI